MNMIYIAPTTKGWTSQIFGKNPGGFNPSGGHTGEDIAIPVGTPLVAMADGVVKHAGYFQGTYADNPWWVSPSFAGFVVVIDYGAYLSLYAHLSASPVKVGQKVTQGQTVAYSGNTGSATTGPHLHWEVMPDGWDFNNGRYGRINPRSIVNSTTPEGFLMALTPAQQTDIYNRITRYLDAPTSAVPEKVWNETVTRGGKQISVKQELADAKSEVQALRAVVIAMSKNADLSADQITAAVKAGLGAITVDVNVSGPTK